MLRQLLASEVGLCPARAGYSRFAVDNNLWTWESFRLWNMLLRRRTGLLIL